MGSRKQSGPLNNPHDLGKVAHSFRLTLPLRWLRNHGERELRGLGIPLLLLAKRLAFLIAKESAPKSASRGAS